MILSLWKNIHVDTIRSFFLNYNWPLLVDSVYKTTKHQTKTKTLLWKYDVSKTSLRHPWHTWKVKPCWFKVSMFNYNQLQTILKYSLINSIIKTLGDSQQGVFSTFIIAYKWYCKNDVFKTSFFSKES